MSAAEPTMQFESLVFGEGIALDDPAETYHEASRLYPSTARARLPGLALLEVDEHVRAGVERSSRRHPDRESAALPTVRLPDAAIADVLSSRASLVAEELVPLDLEGLAAILDVTYAVHRTPRGDRRGVPSAGALYPLEIYAVCVGVAGVPAGIHHYDPFAHRLELLRAGDHRDELARALPDPEPLEVTAVALVVTGVYWRSRFKYGQRGYRFVLLEAGHLAQNLLLACTALGLPALPVGGFYDRLLDAVVGVDGIDESSVYVLLVGGSR